jgi:hypothetical protein
VHLPPATSSLENAAGRCTYEVVSRTCRCVWEEEEEEEEEVSASRRSVPSTKARSVLSAEDEVRARGDVRVRVTNAGGLDYPLV